MRVYAVHCLLLRDELNNKYESFDRWANSNSPVYILLALVQGDDRDYPKLPLTTLGAAHPSQEIQPQLTTPIYYLFATKLPDSRTPQRRNHIETNLVFIDYHPPDGPAHTQHQHLLPCMAVLVWPQSGAQTPQTLPSPVVCSYPMLKSSCC